MATDGSLSKSEAAWRYLLGQVLFDIVIKQLDDGAWSTKLKHKIKLLRNAKLWVLRVGVQSDVNKLEKWQENKNTVG